MLILEAAESAAPTAPTANKMRFHWRYAIILAPVPIYLPINQCNVCYRRRYVHAMAWRLPINYLSHAAAWSQPIKHLPPRRGVDNPIKRCSPRRGVEDSVRLCNSRSPRCGVEPTNQRQFSAPRRGEVTSSRNEGSQSGHNYYCKRARDQSTALKLTLGRRLGSFSSLELVWLHVARSV